MEQMAMESNSPQKFIVKPLKMEPTLKPWLLFIGTLLYCYDHFLVMGGRQEEAKGSPVKINVPDTVQ